MLVIRTKKTVQKQTFVRVILLFYYSVTLIKILLELRRISLCLITLYS